MVARCSGDIHEKFVRPSAIYKVMKRYIINKLDLMNISQFFLYYLMLIFLLAATLLFHMKHLQHPVFMIWIYKTVNVFIFCFE